MDMNVVYAKSEGFVEKQVGEELILVPISNQVANMKEVFTLNELGCFLWNHFDGITTIGKIIESIINQYDVDEHILISDVNDFVGVALNKRVIGIV